MIIVNNTKISIYESILIEYLYGYNHITREKNELLNDNLLSMAMKFIFCNFMNSQSFKNNLKVSQLTIGH